MGATIFQGSYVKTLKAQLKLLEIAYILTGTDDPTAVAKNAPAGSLYMRTGATPGVYYKLDAGTTTNWLPLLATVNPTYVDEAPAGAVNGVNVTYTLSQTPAASNTLNLYLDGLKQREATDYTIVGDTITMLAAPATGQDLWANYVVSAAGLTWSDEAPAGAVDGVNDTFTLSVAPADDQTLHLFQNGLRQREGTDFTIVGDTITMTDPPAVGQDLWANFRVN